MPRNLTRVARVIFLDINMPIMDGFGNSWKIFSKISKVQHNKGVYISSCNRSRDIERAKQYENVSDFYS